jgi:ABC-2 type transport system ATP-binding protein
MELASAIQAQGLTKSYGSVRALIGVDLDVRCGEIFGFLGPNGAGKTTTIRCLLDMIRPDGGTVRVLGMDPQKEPVAVKARVGYLPGELHLEENMSVEGALHYLIHLRKSKVDWKYVRQLANQLDLDLKMSIKNLSKGNKQKVGVVQSLMHQPDLLLLDEPTFGLDPLMQREVLNLVREARERGVTVFFSSHILSEVQEIADRVAIIRQGIVVEVAKTSEIITRSFRRLRLRFRDSVNAKSFEDVPGVQVLSEEDHVVLLQVEGEVDALIKTLAGYTVIDFETERPSLEEIFLAYYQQEK